jgi:hypothetical protein
MKKFFLLLVSGGGFAFLVAGVAAAGLAFLRRFLPQTEGSTRLTGLHGPVEIVRDRWGVPHIYAEDEDDLFFAQGYVHAQDRLWQMELQRRLGSGRLSEILGEPTLEVDRFVRTVGLNRAAEDEVNSLPAETRRALDAYAAGVNSSIRQRRGQWSLEFTLLRCEPQPWRPVDSLYWSKFLTAVLSGNWASETLRARLAVKLGADLAADLEPAYPADNPTVVSGPGLPPGVEPPPNGWRSPAVREALKSGREPAGRRRPPAAAAHAAGRGKREPVRRDPPQPRRQQPVGGQRRAHGHGPAAAGQRHPHVRGHAGHLVPGASGGGRYHVAGVSLPWRARRVGGPQPALRLGADHGLAGRAGPVRRAHQPGQPGRVRVPGAVAALSRLCRRSSPSKGAPSLRWSRSS